MTCYIYNDNAQQETSHFLRVDDLPTSTGTRTTTFRLGSSALVRQLVLEKENSEFKPVKLHLKKKLTMCLILPERRGWVNRTTTFSSAD